MPFQVSYGAAAEQVVSVLLNPLDGHKTTHVYFVNDCPVEADLTLPLSGSGELPGEKDVHTFDFEFDNPVGPHGTQRFQFNPSNVSWTQLACQ